MVKYLSYSYWSNKITDKIYANVPKAQNKSREEVEYGAYMALSEVSKMLVLFVAAWILHAVGYVIAIILLFGLLRWNLGGIHAKTHWACMLSYSVFIYGILGASLFTGDHRIVLNLLVIPFSLIVTYLYAPADMPVKPVVSKKQRMRLRITGFILLSILFILAQFSNQTWFNIIMFTCGPVGVLMTPPIYRLTKNEYGRKEVSV